jgi:hypothetical protein
MLHECNLLLMFNQGQFMDLFLAVFSFILYSGQLILHLNYHNFAQYTIDY